VVTGSNKGLGQATVLLLARHGVRVDSTARNAQLGAATVALAVEAEPQLAGLIRFHQLDVTSERSVADLAVVAEHVRGNRHPDQQRRGIETEARRVPRRSGDCRDQLLRHETRHRNVAAIAATFASRSSDRDDLHSNFSP
jgi:hypothetical protein